MGNPFDEKDPYKTPYSESSSGYGQNTKNEQSWALGIHLSGLVSTMLGGGLFGFVGPLIMWLVKREESEYLDDQGKEAVNFHLSMDIWYLAAGAITAISCGALFIALIVPFILQVIFSIVAAVKVNQGGRYRYPLTIRIF